MDRVKAKKKTELLRNAIQIIFFFIFPSAFSSAFASVKEIGASLSEGAPLTFSPFAKTAVFLLAFTVICGRYFCGYACAFGTLGDGVYQLSQLIQRKTGKKIPRIPSRAVRYMQLLKYVVLAGIFVLCFLGYQGDVNKNSPWTLFSVLMSLKKPSADMIAAGVLLLLIIIGMAVQSRFFCQFLCPMGALFSLMPVLPSGQLVRDEESCIHGCQICERGCPVRLKFGVNDLREGECVRCNKCLAMCPRGNIGLKHFPVSAADPVWVIFQGAVLLIVLKFVI